MSWYCFKNIVLHKVLNHRGILAAESRISHRSLSNFCLLLIHPHPYNRKKKTSREVKNSQAEKKKNIFKKSIPCCLQYTPLQQSFLKQFCAADMKRHTHTPLTPHLPKKYKSLQLSVIFLTVPWTLGEEPVSHESRESIRFLPRTLCFQVPRKLT